MTALTIVMIAHRMDSLTPCDQVVDIDGVALRETDCCEDLNAYLSDPPVRASLPTAETRQEFD